MAVVLKKAEFLFVGGEKDCIRQAVNILMVINSLLLQAGGEINCSYFNIYVEIEMLTRRIHF
jgi:hypothetical protein